jgi:hypothetical protein
MKAVLLRLFILPTGLLQLISLCVLSLILLHAPLSPCSPQAKGDRDEFPGQRRGGGTHWAITLDHVA